MGRTGAKTPYATGDVVRKTFGWVAVAALVLGAAAPAQAWVNASFGVGIGFSYQSGGNSLPWGAWRNGPMPGHYAPYGYGGHHGWHGWHQGWHAPGLYTGGYSGYAPAPAYYVPSFAPAYDAFPQFGWTPAPVPTIIRDY